MKYRASAGKSWRKKSCIYHCECLDLRSQNDCEAEFLAKLFNSLVKGEEIRIRFNENRIPEIVSIEEDKNDMISALKNYKEEIDYLCSFPDEEQF